MKQFYRATVLALAVAALAVPAQQAQAQAGDTLWVEWQDQDTGLPIINALRNAIAGDTTETGERVANRVYGLYRSGLYYNDEIIAANNGYHLSIAGESSMPGGEVDFGPAVIQMVVREDGSSPGRLFTVQDDITLRHLWISGQDDAGGRGAYLPIFVEASGIRVTIDHVILERTDFSLIGLAGGDNDVFITNSTFRNHDNRTQQWEGRGIRYEAGGDTLVMENNTFLNFGHTIVQSETAPLNYIRFNHNTVVNVGRAINSGGIWRTAFFTNNLVINPYWHGEGVADYDVEGRDDPYTGFFGIAELPPAYGTNLGRRIVYANNAHWRDPQFEEYYADTIRAQPLFNSITQMFFDDYSNINESNNIWQDEFPDVPVYDAAPGVDQFPETSVSLRDLVPDMIRNMRDLREGEPTPFTSWLWDPGRDPQCYEGACFYYPLPEDFSYTNANLLDAGTDGLPLGDLNWFPSELATFEANQEQYVAEIEGMAEAERVDIVSTLEAETAALDGAAEVSTPEGFTYYRFEAGGYVEWNFDVPEAGTYQLNLETNMGTESRRGQRVLLNGTNLQNHEGYGEYYFCSVATEPDCDAVNVILPQEEWATLEITQDILVAGAEALDMEAGPGTLRIEPSWGYQSFGGFELVNTTTGTTVSMTAAEATSEVAMPVCDEAAYCPQGFQAVALTGAGSLTWNVDAPANGEYLLRVFYQANEAAQAEIQVDGNVVIPALALEGGDEEGTSVVTDRFTLGQGMHTVTLSSGAGLTVDFIQLLGVNLSTAAERNELPDGYALDQNYPNPFNPATTIRYELGTTSRVTLTVYDVLGRRVATLLDGSQVAGTHHVNFDGSQLPSGVYFYQLETAVGRQVRSMILVK